MTALSSDNNAVAFRGMENADTRRYPVEDNVKIYKGGIVVLDSSGYARPARNTSGELVVGIALEQFDNTGTGHAAGATVGGKTGIRVVSNVHALLLCSATVAQTSVGLTFYALDDQTARATAGAAGNVVGVVTEFIDSTHAWIWIYTPDANNSVPTGDQQIVAGNLRLGAVSAFGTTEPTSAVVMKQGTAFAGAIATSGAIQSDGTVIKKIIAAGTVSNVET